MSEVILSVAAFAIPPYTVFAEVLFFCAAQNEMLTMSPPAGRDHQPGGLLAGDEGRPDARRSPSRPQRHKRPAPQNGAM